MARARRTTEEVKKLAEEAKALVEGGMSESAATDQVGIAHSVYARIIKGYNSPAKVARAAKAAKKKGGRKQRQFIPEPRIAKLVAKVDALRTKGATADVAIDKVGISKTVYWNRKKAGLVHGSINAASLPPRPKKKHGGARNAKPVDMNNLASIAVRIARIDKKLRDVTEMQSEREELKDRMLALLK